MLANHFGTDHDQIHQELCDFGRSIHHAKNGHQGPKLKFSSRDVLRGKSLSLIRCQFLSEIG